ncbi:MAG TPA: type II CAAX endopeptidase family protein [Pseudolabrys sp.]|jgi:membrane protease YdiL (CAAX protease family)|nr:type II CAAX endopeptidase family protein [Pseudolabrys sp.]
MGRAAPLEKSVNEKGDKALPWSSLASPWLFFVLVFCWTWFFWILAAASGISAQSALGTALEVLGLLGPMLGGIGFTYLTKDHEGWLEYWSRIIDPKRIPPKWYLFIFLFVPGLFAIAVLLDVASSGSATLVLTRERLTPFLSVPSTIVPYLLAVFIYGPFPEELGWRGYVLDRLQARWNALVSSLILGAIWTLWHLPLFFIKDTLFYIHGAWSPWFWQFMMEVIPFTVIFTWIFNNTRRSTLAAILFHFIANLTPDLVNVTAGTNFYSTLLWIIAAIIVVIFWGAGTLRQREHAREC